MRPILVQFRRRDVAESFVSEHVTDLIVRLLTADFVFCCALNSHVESGRQFEVSESED